MWRSSALSSPVDTEEIQHVCCGCASSLSEQPRRNPVGFLLDSSKSDRVHDMPNLCRQQLEYKESYQPFFLSLIYVWAGLMRGLGLCSCCLGALPAPSVPTPGLRFTADCQGQRRFSLQPGDTRRQQTDLSVAVANLRLSHRKPRLSMLRIHHSHVNSGNCELC